jgi:parallel beta-helix repeat protein
MAGYGLLLGGQGELVEAVHLKFNGMAGVWLAGGTVRNCSAVRNGYGFQVAGLGGSVLEGNTASFNQFDGFAVEGSTVVGNVSSNNGGYGLVGSSVVYGSNSFYNNNAADIGRILNGTSQNNNHCTMTTC